MYIMAYRLLPRRIKSARSDTTSPLFGPSCLTSLFIIRVQIQSLWSNAPLISSFYDPPFFYIKMKTLYFRLTRAGVKSYYTHKVDIFRFPHANFIINAFLVFLYMGNFLLLCCIAQPTYYIFCQSFIRARGICTYARVCSISSLDSRYICAHYLRPPNSLTCKISTHTLHQRPPRHKYSEKIGIFVVA